MGSIYLCIQHASSIYRVYIYYIISTCICKYVRTVNAKYYGSTWITYPSAPEFLWLQNQQPTAFHRSHHFDLSSYRLVPATAIANTLLKSKMDLKHSTSLWLNFSNNYHKKHKDKCSKELITYILHYSNENPPFMLSFWYLTTHPSLCRHHIFFADENRPTR